MAGAIFENYVVAEVLKKELHTKSFAELYYLRSSKGAEIDLIVDRKITRELIEIKFNSTFNPNMVSEINKIIAPDEKGYLLYTGDNIKYDEKISVMKYSDYLI